MTISKSTRVGKSKYTLEWDGSPGYATFTRENPGQKHDLVVHIPKNIIVEVLVDVLFDRAKSATIDFLRKAK